MIEPASLTDVLVYLAEAPGGIIFLIKVTALIAAAWLLHQLLARRNPRWRVIVWRGLAVGVLCLPLLLGLLPTWQIQVEKPLEPRSEAARLHRLAAALVGQADRHSEAERSNRSFAGAPSSRSVTVSNSGNGLQLKTGDPAKQSAKIGPIAEIRRLLNWRIWFLPEVRWRWLLAVWLLGTSILTFRLILGFRLLKRLLALSTPAREDIVQESRRIAQALGVHRPFIVRELQFVTPPFLCGLRQPVLVLPTRMCDDDFRRELPAILAHELSHLRSFDLLWNPALHVISILLWFHPLTWRMRHAHASACESVADSVSAAFLGDRIAYSRTLARVALEMASPPPVVGMAMARISDVRRRLEILNRSVSSGPLPVSRVLSFGLIGVLALVLLGGMRIGFAEPMAKTGGLPSTSVSHIPPDAAVATPARVDRNALSALSQSPQDNLVTGQVRTPDGRPLSKAQVVISTPQNPVTIENGYPALPSNGLLLETDHDGRIVFEPPPSPYRILVFHESGFVNVPDSTFRKAPDIVVPPWARAVGTLHIGPDLGAGETISLVFKKHHAEADAKEPTTDYIYETTTNADGQFVFERVPPGPGRVARMVTVSSRNGEVTTTTHSLSVVFSPGETTHVALGGDGRPVVGRVVLPRRNRPSIDWTWAYGQLEWKAPSPASKDAAAALATADPIRSYAFALQADGSFRAEDVLPGTYELTIRVEPPPRINGGTRSRPLIGTVRREVKVDVAPGERTNQPVDLGLLRMITIRSSGQGREVARPNHVKFQSLTSESQNAVNAPPEEKSLRSAVGVP